MDNHRVPSPYAQRHQRAGYRAYTTSLKMQLAQTNRALAERDSIIREMQEQLARLLAVQGLPDTNMPDAALESGHSKTEGPQVL